MSKSFFFQRNFTDIISKERKIFNVDWLCRSNTFCIRYIPYVLTYEIFEKKIIHTIDIVRVIFYLLLFYLPGTEKHLIFSRADLRWKLRFDVAFLSSDRARLYEMSGALSARGLPTDYFDRSNPERVLLELPTCRNDRAVGAARHESRHKVSPSFPYRPPYPPGATSASFAPPALGAAHHHGPLTRELSTRDLSIGFSHS